LLDFGLVFGASRQKLHTFGEPTGDLGTAKAVVDMTAVAAFGYQMVLFQGRKVLGNAGVANGENVLQTVYVHRSVPELLNNPNPVRVTEYPEQVRHLLS
jgi:hypothetical protein